jgi:hypothetical protein
MRRCLKTAGAFALYFVCLWTSPGYGEQRDSFSAGFRAGADVTVEAGERVNGELVAAGANLNLGGDFQEELKAFGANVTIPGKVTDELFVAGANVILSGSFNDKVKAFGANVVLAGTFAGDVEVAAARVILTPTSVIKGDLRYAAAVLDRQQGSQVLGRVKPYSDKFEAEGMDAWREKGRKAAAWAWVVFQLVSMASLVLAGFLLHTFFPGISEKAVDLISDSPWVSLGVGVVFLVAVPLALVITMVTVVGIPLATIAGLLYIVIIYLSRISISVWIGRKVMGVLAGRRIFSFFWPLVIGVVIIGLVGLIPFLGWLFRILCLLVGLGALWLALWRSRMVESRL